MLNIIARTDSTGLADPMDLAEMFIARGYRKCAEVPIGSPEHIHIRVSGGVG